MERNLARANEKFEVTVADYAFCQNRKGEWLCAYRFATGDVAFDPVGASELSGFLDLCGPDAINVLGYEAVFFRLPGFPWWRLHLTQDAFATEAPPPQQHAADRACQAEVHHEEQS